MKRYTPPPDVTLWQRFWWSPWTWLAFAVTNWWAYDIDHTDGRWFYFAFAMVWTLYFFHYADKRWGRRV